MKNSRVVLAVEESLAGTVIDEWASRLEARPAPPPEIRKPRIEEVGKCRVLRWEWMPLTEKDVYDLISVCELLVCPYEMIVIGDRSLDDVQYWHGAQELPVQLTARVEVKARIR